MPVWRTIGKSRALTTAKNLPKTLLISGLILATLLGLIILWKDFELKADGQLMPVTRRNVFFTEEGKVTEIKVKHGQMVKKGEPLVILENHVLKSQIAETQKNYDAVTAQIDMVFRTVRDRRQQSQQAGLLELVEKKNHLAGELERLQTREKALTVVSPIDGQIMTSKLEDLLSDRPGRCGAAGSAGCRPDRRMGIRNLPGWEEDGPFQQSVREGSESRSLLYPKEQSKCEANGDGQSIRQRQPYA